MVKRKDRKASALFAGAPPLALVLAVAFGAAGCGGTGGAGDATTAIEAPAQTESQPAATETETETQPQPVTAAEQRWLRVVKRYTARFEREYFVSGALTHASMRRNARLFRDCRPMLRRAGKPGRLEPAAKRARRACERLERAAKHLDQAIAVSDPGGSVVSGTEEARIFERSYDAAAEAAGNAFTGLQRAGETGDEITRTLGS